MTSKFTKKCFVLVKKNRQWPMIQIKPVFMFYLWEYVAVTLAFGGRLCGLDVHGAAEGGPAVVSRRDRESEHVWSRIHRALCYTDRSQTLMEIINNN